MPAQPRKDRPRYEKKGYDAYGRRKSFYGATAEEAQAKADAAHALARDTTLYGFYVRAYLPSVEHRSANWLMQIRWAMDQYILPAFGQTDLDQIDRPQIQRFINSLHGRLSTGSIGHVKRVLSCLLNLAEADEIIRRNPCRFVRLPRGKKEPVPYLRADELARLLDAADDVLRPLVLLAGCAGLPVGEACAVTWGAIDRDGVLDVRCQVLQPPGGAIVSQYQKTDNRRRELPLPAGMIEELRSCNQVSGIYVVSNVDGGYLLPKNVHRSLSAACERAGVRRVTPHGLRHSFTSIIENELEAPRRVVKELLGHSRRTVTDEYSHVSTRLKARWMEALWEHLSRFRCRQTCRHADQISGSL